MAVFYTIFFLTNIFRKGNKILTFSNNLSQPSLNTVQGRHGKQGRQGLVLCLDFGFQSKLYTPSTLNNSNRAYILCALAEPAVLGSAKTALKFKYEI